MNLEMMKFKFLEKNFDDKVAKYLKYVSIKKRERDREILLGTMN